MNKTKMILAGTGGAISLIVLVLAFLVWQSYSAKVAAIEGDDDEGIDGLETVQAKAQGLSRKSVYPCAASVASITANQKALGDWCKESLALAARGDRVFEKTTPAKFKAFIVDDAKRIAAFPGAVQGKLVKPDFAFGPFKDYIVEGKMPVEAELGVLQRRWDDLVTVAELLATNGISELLDVGFAAVKSEEGRVKSEELKKGKSSKGKKNSSSENSSLFTHHSSFSYVFTFAAKPSAFIRALNELEASERFMTVDDFSFSRPVDVIATALGGDEKKDAAPAAGGRRGRRGRRGAAEQPNAEAPRGEDAAGTVNRKNGIVTDPLLDAPMTVTMTVTVHDFRSLEENGEAESLPSQEKGASK